MTKTEKCDMRVIYNKLKKQDHEQQLRYVKFLCQEKDVTFLCELVDKCHPILNDESLFEIGRVIEHFLLLSTLIANEGRFEDGQVELAKQAIAYVPYKENSSL